MRPLPFIWPYALVFWMVYFWAFGSEMVIVFRGQRSAAKRDSVDAGSLQVVTIGMSLALMLAFALAFVPALRFPQTAALPAFWTGLTLLIAGALLRRHCWRVLGEFFTGDVQARAEQPVIDRGAYRWVRHPSYSAGIVMMIGIGVALGSWLSVVVSTTLTVVSYSYRIVVEERALTAALGEKYVEFSRTRKRLIPFVV
ncbi:MAG: methyltransferase family protein [Thermoanaerobaculia bacterium]